jgi:diguanylate cyclase (GGDEF)-like protein
MWGAYTVDLGHMGITAVHGVRVRAMPRLILVGACVLAFIVILRLKPGGDLATRAIDDLVQLAAAVLAAVAVARRARRARGRERLSWAFLAAAPGSWAAAQVVWSYYELIAGHATPFPSIADAGFLAFPVMALIGIFLRPSAAFRGQGRLRLGLDGVLVAASLFVVTWATALGQVAHAGGSSSFAFVVSLAYPVADLVLLTVTVVVLTHSQGDVRRGLLPLGVALGLMAVSDSGFAYLTVLGTYSTGNIVDAGWVSAFLLLVVAAAESAPRDDDPTTRTVSHLSLLLPYVPALLAIGVALPRIIGAHQDNIIVAGVTVMGLVIFVRQLVALLDNRALVERVSYQAFHDGLTGLANRALFTDRVNHAVDLHARDLRPLAIVYLDLDDFKVVNDTLGHPAGDELLVQVAQRMRETVRTGDTVARLGGDEFALLSESSGDAAVLGLRLLEAFERPVLVAGRQLNIRASIGVAALAPEAPAISGEELLKHADTAMYAAKRMGKGGVVHYRSDLADVEGDELDLRMHIASAVASGDITVAYQPIYAASGELAAYEALARWKRNDHDVSPGRFIPIARRAGVLAALDSSVITQAMATVGHWPGAPELNVNVSTELLNDPTFPEWLRRALADHEFPADRLVVEVLESEIVEHMSAAIESLHQVRKMGVRVALDDFGVGYSSLSRLQTLPVDVIKIDRSFITPLDDPAAITTCFAGVVDLAHRIGATTIAEGVETEQQLRTVVSLGSDAAQGFLLGRPAPASAHAFTQTM